MTPLDRTSWGLEGHGPPILERPVDDDPSSFSSLTKQLLVHCRWQIVFCPRVPNNVLSRLYLLSLFWFLIRISLVLLGSSLIPTSVVIQFRFNLLGIFQLYPCLSPSISMVLFRFFAFLFQSCDWILLWVCLNLARCGFFYLILLWIQWFSWLRALWLRGLSTWKKFLQKFLVDATCCIREMIALMEYSFWAIIGVGWFVAKFPVD